ncbi:MAG: hypothetical protein GWN30_19510, partial [Gammaproteobacteria bacterium]|nr:hypothetical protein [Gammaproteobacteria bacterium]
SDLLLHNPFHVGSVLLDREWQEKVGFFDESLRSYEDWDMWLRLAKAGCKMGWVAEPVSLYRFHSEQMTRDGAQMTNATFSVLEKTYEDPGLPDSWRNKKDLAYSSAYLRAAPQAYREGFYEKASAYLNEAVQLAPELKANQGDQIAKKISAWVDFGKTDEPLHYMENIYNHLPDSLSELRLRRNSYLAQKALDLAFRSYNQNNLKTARQLILCGIRYKPGIILNRGVLSILLRSLLSNNEL